MQTGLAKALFLAGARARNPSLSRALSELKESEWMSRNDLASIQQGRLRRLLNHAEQTSPYYRELFQRAGIVASDIRSVGDLTRIPVTTKAKLIEQNASVHSTSVSRGGFIAETSGTSGAALEFLKSERWDSYVRAHMYRSYAWYDVMPWERNGYLWGYNISSREAWKVRFLDAMQNRFRLFRYDSAAIRTFARRLSSAVFLSGYSSMIYEVARELQDSVASRLSLKLVKGTSETILDAYQQVAVNAFGRRITSEYGAAEAGLIAFECPSGRMHVNVESVVLEVGEDGEAIVTNLVSDSFPIIRYSLGDAIAVSDESCHCGRNHPILAEVIGRRGATVIGLKGRYPALTFYYIFKNIALQHGLLLNYRATQDAVGRCTVHIEGRSDPRVFDYVKREASKYFGEDVQIGIEFAPTLLVAGKKAQYFTSRIQEPQSRTDGSAKG